MYLKYSLGYSVILQLHSKNYKSDGLTPEESISRLLVCCIHETMANYSILQAELDIRPIEYIRFFNWYELY